MKVAQIIVLCATAVSAAQPHRHGHRHADKHGSPVEKRADVTKVVEGPTVTEYVLNGQVLSAEEVAAGLADGIYVLVSDSTTSTTSSTTSSTVAPPTSTKQAAEFYQQSTTSKSTTSIAPTSTYVPPPPPPSTTSSSTPPPAATSASSSNSGGSGGSGLNSNFPSGTIPCGHFPAEYGPIPLDYLGLGGWSGIQQCPGFSFGMAAISFIATAVSGSICTSGDFCSYACPPGWQKSQWPTAQGSTGQSIGGLYCSTAGFLELSNPSVQQLCIKGTGGVQIQNKLSSNAALCRTDYPGTESETIALNTLPGQTYEVTCPDANTYYSWKGGPTSAQYYLNDEGISPSDACTWGNAPTPQKPQPMGNWAPMNIGVGRGTSGETFISIFPNTPTNDISVKLNFNVAIVGGVSADCKYVGGQYYMNGAPSPNGCTVSVSSAGATFVLTDA